MNKNIVYHRIARQAIRELHLLVQTGGKYGTYALWKATFESLTFDQDKNTITFRFRLERTGTSPNGLDEMRQKISRAMPEDIGPYHRSTCGLPDNSPSTMTMSIRYAKKKNGQAQAIPKQK